MPYVGLGRRTQNGVSDATVQGNPFLLGTGWDVLFTPDVLATNLTTFEVYQISLDGPVGSSVQVAIDGAPWNHVNQGWLNSWDPAQPMLLNNGNTVQFFWTVPFASGPYNRTTNIRPTVTLWLRHETGTS